MPPTIDPEPAATIGATMGSSQVAVIVLSVGEWMSILRRSKSASFLRRLHYVLYEDIHYERHAQTRRHGEHSVDPPEGPSDSPPVSSPCWNTDKADHIDDSSESHWEAAEEETLRRMPNHGAPNLRIERISQQAD